MVPALALDVMCQICRTIRTLNTIFSGGSREYSLYSNELPLLAGCLDFVIVIAALALRHNAKLPVALHT